MDTKVHVFDIQWDKYGAPRFVINFGEAPIEGLDVDGKRVPAAKVEMWHCSIGGRLQRRRGPYLRDWFQLKKPLLEALRSMKWSYDPEEVVGHVKACFHELDAWWASKEEGPHIYIVSTLSR